MEAAQSSETLESYDITIRCHSPRDHDFNGYWRWRQNSPPKRRDPTKSLDGVIIQETTILIGTEGGSSIVLPHQYTISQTRRPWLKFCIRDSSTSVWIT